MTHTYDFSMLGKFYKVMLDRSWFSSFRLLFKERLGSLSCSRSGEDSFFLHPTFVIHTDVEFFSSSLFRWGANQAG
jgi:hypothetical protein